MSRPISATRTAVATLILLISTLWHTDPAVAQSSGYTDVAGTHAAAIAAVTEAAIARGCEPNRYCPEEYVRRDQMASFLARALDLGESPGNRFSDVSVTNTHAGAINAVADAGITEGCAEGRYCPAQPVSRAEMATFLSRAFDLAGAQHEYFHDVGGTHAAAAQRLGQAGISAGCNPLGLAFCPDQLVRRDQMASFLARAIELIEPVSIPMLLESGDEGPHVEALQRRLRRADYWVGPVDGVYGTLTEHAVLAIQKVHGLTRDGVYGPNTRAVVAAPQPPAVASSSGYVIEFDEDRQIVMLVQDGVAGMIFHAAGGDESYYTYDGDTYWAETPNGSFEIQRQINGWRTSHLGRLYRPKYFYGGIAFHGYTNVPAYAASHGCVRVSLGAMDWLWANDAMPIGADVLVYGSP